MDTATGRITHTLEGAGPPLAFTRDGRRLVTLKVPDASSTIGVGFQIWDVESGAVLRTVDLQGLLAGGSGAFSADGRQLALLHGPQNSVSLWDAGSGAKLRLFTPNGAGNLVSMALSANGRWLAMGDQDKTIWLWEVQSGTPRTLVGHSGPVWRLAFSADGRQLASLSGDKTLKLWDVETGRAIKSAASGGNGLIYARDGRRLAVMYGSDLTIWPLEPAPAVAGK
jgi:WD40 repeat protein